MLTTFLMATRAGLLRLSWDLLCPACEAPTAVERLKDLPAGGHCPACDIDFTTNFAENVEATFAPEPAIRRAERLVFCHGSPSTTKSWICQVQVPSNGERALTVHLGVGRYRLQASGVAKPVFLDVKEVGGRSTTLALDDVAGAEGSDAVLTCAEASVAAGAVDVHLVNQSGLPRRFQIAHRAFASQAATAADVTSIGLFRELFGSEVLAPDQHILVGRRSILFTDLVGSTAMYERLGDVSAYAVVRAHFALLFDTIAAHNGSVVKTVGDCVMASFDLPIDAARAGIACIRALATLRTNTGEAPMLRLKVGVHHGPCLAVEANGLTDYFGRTVNIAARVESLARPDELVLSWAVLDDVDVKAWLETLAADALATSTDRKAVKGIDGEVSIARVFADASQAAEVAR